MAIPTIIPPGIKTDVPKAPAITDPKFEAALTTDEARIFSLARSFKAYPFSVLSIISPIGLTP